MKFMQIFKHPSRTLTLVYFAIVAFFAIGYIVFPIAKTADLSLAGQGIAGLAGYCGLFCFLGSTKRYRQYPSCWCHLHPHMWRCWHCTCHLRALFLQKTPSFGSDSPHESRYDSWRHHCGRLHATLWRIWHDH